VALADAGVLARHGVKLIGANIDAIKVGEDRLLFREAMEDIGVEVPASGLARSLDADARATSVSASPAYGSPESLTTGKSAPNSDQYSFAISYYELRTGNLPFEDETYFAVLKAHSSTFGGTLLAGSPFSAESSARGRAP